MLQKSFVRKALQVVGIGLVCMCICFFSYTCLAAESEPEQTDTQRVTLTDEENEFIKKCEPLLVAVADDMAPVEYFDERTGTFRGITIDVLKRISDETGLQFICVKRNNTEKLLRQMDTGEIRLVGSLKADSSEARRLCQKVTAPIYTNSISAISKQFNYLNPSCTLAVCSGQPMFDYLATDMKYQTIIKYDTIRECLNAVNDGEADLTFISTYMIGSYLNHNYYSELNTYVLQDTYGDYGIGIYESSNKVENEMLYSIINKAVQSISEQELNDIHALNLITAPTETNIKDFWETNKPIFYWAAFVLIAASMLIIFLNLKRARKMNRMLMKAAKEKSDFFSRMSHDIRTPLNGIIGITELAFDDNGTSYKEDLKKIKTSALFLKTLVNDILDMNKIENHEMKFQPVAYSGKELIQYLEAVIVPLCDEKKLNFTYNINEIKDCSFICDSMRLNQVLFNLLANSIKYTDVGGSVMVSAAVPIVNNEWLRMEIKVKDTGIGMSEEFQKHLFEPYSRENDRVRVSDVAGTGLGLSITKQIVDLMQGTISVKSRLGEGTEFTICLQFPLIERAVEISHAKEKNGVANLAGKCILLCEDHPLNSEIAERLLKKVGMIVEKAENGQLCLDKFKSHPEGYFDMILMDIRMPIMDGLEATRNIRLLERTDAKTIPIAAMTANAFEEDIQKSMEAGMNAYLTKPIDAGLLYDTIGRCVGKNYS